MADQVGVLRSQVANVLVRVLKEEAHNLTSQATHYPVESGDSIADHVVLNPNAVDIRFVMPNSGPGAAEQARSVFQQFIQMRDEREPVELMTEHVKYKNMVLVGLAVDHAAPFRGAFSASVRLEQVGIIGESKIAAAHGGRPESVLTGGGVQKTACGATCGGEQPGVTSGVTLTNCGSCLANGGTYN
jgi:hypothetical protein